MNECAYLINTKIYCLDCSFDPFLWEDDQEKESLTEKQVMEYGLHPGDSILCQSCKKELVQLPPFQPSSEVFSDLVHVCNTLQSLKIQNRGVEKLLHKIAQRLPSSLQEEYDGVPDELEQTYKNLCERFANWHDDFQRGFEAFSLFQEAFSRIIDFLQEEYES